MGLGAPIFFAREFFSGPERVPSLYLAAFSSITRSERVPGSAAYDVFITKRRGLACGFYRWPALAAAGSVPLTGCTYRQFP